MKNCLITLLGLSLLGCTPSGVILYEWDAHHLSFEYPAEFNLVEGTLQNQLFIVDEKEVPDLEGSPLHLMTLIVRDGIPLQGAIDGYKNYEDVSIQEILIGPNTFTQVDYTFPMDEVKDTVYLLELNENKTLEFYSGRTSLDAKDYDEETAKVILDSIQIL